MSYERFAGFNLVYTLNVIDIHIYFFISGKPVVSRPRVPIEVWFENNFKPVSAVGVLSQF